MSFLVLVMNDYREVKPRFGLWTERKDRSAKSGRDSDQYWPLDLQIDYKLLLTAESPRRIELR